MKIYHKIILVMIISCSNIGFSQVGMTGNNPHKSAALDITATNKGVLFPRISLSSTSDTSKIINNQPANTMMVYNTNSSIGGIGAEGKGYYYWEGGIWKKMGAGNMNASTVWSINGNSGTNPNVNFLGTIDNADFIFKTNNTEKMHIVNTSGNVGIGTTAPAYKLDVNGTAKVGGDLFIGTANAVPENVILPQLFRNDVTGEIYKSGSSRGNASTLNYVKYTFENVSGCTANDVDTKIPTSEYVLVTVGSSFGGLGPSIGLKVNGYSGTYVPQDVHAFQSGGTWHITADYKGAIPSNAANGTWVVYCLVLNNSVVKELPEQAYNAGGSANFSATAMPAGL